jgi:3-phosphoshikimate 1-carboxyvinyltransferase
MGEGETAIEGFHDAADTRSTLAAVEALGAGVQGVGAEAMEATIRVRGVGLRGAVPARVDVGNAGTLLRLLPGWLAGQGTGAWVLDGDESIRRRPVDRVAEPLTAMGATVSCRDGRLPPLRVEGAELRAIEYRLPVASAQVKSCVLFAGLAAEGETTLVEPRVSRDHTERLLTALGAPVERSEGTGGSHHVRLRAFSPPPFELDVPGDVSAAAFLVAAGALAGDVRIDGVGLNRTRTGFLEAARRMGAGVEWSGRSESMGEPFGTIEVRRGELAAITIPDAGPEIHDELPLLAVMATQAAGETTVRGASELRVKESDRIAALVGVLRRLGARVEELPDGFTVSGPTALTGAVVDSCGDHRIAMAAAVAALIATGETRIEGFGSAAVSWPTFEHALASLGADVEVA